MNVQTKIALFTNITNIRRRFVAARTACWSAMAMTGTMAAMMLHMGAALAILMEIHLADLGGSEDRTELVVVRLADVKHLVADLETFLDGSLYLLISRVLAISLG